MIYPSEREVEYGTSRAIEDYFGRHGFQIIVLPNTQQPEKYIPFDPLFVAGNVVKMFGLQYKRLEPNPDHWTLKTSQYQTISKFGWIYYGLPEVRTWQECQDNQTLLDALRIVNPHRIPHPLASTNTIKLYTNQQTASLSPIKFLRWSNFVRGLFECPLGVRIPTPEELRMLFRQAEYLRDALIDIYALSFGTEPIVHRYSPFLREIPPDDEQE